MPIITTASEFNDLCLFLTQSAPDFIAVDTEFIREKTYWPQWSLLQLATTEKVYIIDVINLDKGKDFSAFKDLLQQRSILKVFHACRQDVEIFLHELNIIPDAFFDCQVAAYLCGFQEGIGLAKLAQELLDVEVTKTQQHTNWLSRPLSPHQLAYATADVEVIKKLYHALFQQIETLGRWGWLYEEQLHLSMPETYQQDCGEMWRRIKTPEKMKASKRALLQELCRWREEKAQQLNYNRGRVMTEDLLIKIINLQPESIVDLADQAPEISLEHLDEIWMLLLAFKDRRPHTYPTLKLPPSRPLYLLEAFAKMTPLRRRIASDLGIAERLLGNDEAIRDFISGAEVIFSQGWRFEVFGIHAQEILNEYIKVTPIMDKDALNARSNERFLDIRTLKILK